MSSCTMNEIENEKIITFFVLSERAGPYMDLGREQGEFRLNFVLLRISD